MEITHLLWLAQMQMQMQMKMIWLNGEIAELPPPCPPFCGQANVLNS